MAWQTKLQLTRNDKREFEMPSKWKPGSIFFFCVAHCFYRNSNLTNQRERIRIMNSLNNFILILFSNQFRNVRNISSFG